MNSGEEEKKIEALREEVDGLRKELEVVREAGKALDLKLKAKEAESEGWRLKYEELKKRSGGKTGSRNGGSGGSNDTMNRRNATSEPSIDTIERSDETLNRRNDITSSSIDTLKPSADTITHRNETTDSSNDNLPASNDISPERNETSSLSNDTIRLKDTSNAAQKEEMKKKVNVRMREIVAKKHKQGKIIDRKAERLAGVLTMLAEEAVKITRAELVEQFGSTASTMHREMKILKKAGLVRFRGSRKSGTFALTEAGKEMIKGI
jgi:DNA-binding transcriptional ArsR family regulator